MTPEMETRSAGETHSLFPEILVPLSRGCQGPISQSPKSKERPRSRAGLLSSPVSLWPTLWPGPARAFHGGSEKENQLLIYFSGDPRLAQGTQ